jgi:hypothetical protein
MATVGLDCRKPDLLKDYDPERCMCKEPPEGELACGEGCINRYCPLIIVQSPLHVILGGIADAHFFGAYGGGGGGVARVAETVPG